MFYPIPVCFFLHHAVFNHQAEWSLGDWVAGTGYLAQGEEAWKENPFLMGFYLPSLGHQGIWALLGGCWG